MSGDRLVLAYHAVARDWDSSLAVTPDALAEQVDLLTARGYRGVTFTQAVLGPAKREPVFAVTFDDAYRSVHRLAWPVLAERDVPATVFVPTRFPGSEAPMSWPGIDNWIGTEHEAELVCMSWDELDELARAGWEIGSHTRSHPRLTRLEDASLAHELRVSKETCERALGRPCTSLAYPFGDFNSRVSASAAAAGYEVAAGMPGRYRENQPLAWPRVGVYPADDLRRFRMKVDPRMRKLRATKAWETAWRLLRRPGS